MILVKVHLGEDFLVIKKFSILIFFGKGIAEKLMILAQSS